MSNNRQFAYSSGNDDATDSYLEGVAGKRVDYTRQQEMSVQGGAGGATWYADMGEPGYKNKCSRYIVIIFGVVLMLVGGGVIAVARIQKERKVLPVCPDCNTIITIMYIFGGALILVALLGLAAAVTRVKCLAYFFSMIMLSVALGCMGAGFAVVAIDVGLNKDQTELAKLWTDTIKDEPQAICDLQSALECSGFTQCCGTVNIADATIEQREKYYPISNVSLSTCNVNGTAAYAQECASQCDTNSKYTETCHDKVVDELHKYFKPLLGVCFGLALILFITAIASCRMTTKNS